MAIGPPLFKLIIPTHDLVSHMQNANYVFVNRRSHAQQRLVPHQGHGTMSL